MNARGPYKRKSKLEISEDTWAVNDIVQTGSTRWAIRILDGDHVELEAMSVHPGIWWTTTLANLPTKAAAA